MASLTVKGINDKGPIHFFPYFWPCEELERLSRLLRARDVPGSNPKRYFLDYSQSFQQAVTTVTRAKLNYDRCLPYTLQFTNHPERLRSMHE
jgi:hypothetical protein